MLDANRRAVMELSADISHISVAGTPPGAPLGRVDGQEEGGQESKGFEGAAEGNEADNLCVAPVLRVFARGGLAALARADGGVWCAPGLCLAWQRA